MKKLFSILLSAVMLLSLMPVVASAEEIQSVHIEITEAKIGEHPSFNVKIKDSRYQVNSSSLDLPGGIVWWDETQMRELKSADLFEEGHKYLLGIALKATDGNTFSFNEEWNEVETKVYINGAPALADLTPQDSQKDGAAVIGVMKTYDFTQTSKAEMIDEVAVRMVTPPSIGVRQDFTAVVPGDSNYEVEGALEWYDETDKRFLETYETFQLGHIYTVQVAVVPKDGYIFDASVTGYNMTATLNGKEAKLTKAFEYQTWAKAVVSYTFPELKELKKITRINVSDIKEPKIGRQSIARAHYLTYTEGIQGVEASWHEDKDFQNEFRGIFEENKAYSFMVVLEAEEGYEFARTGSDGVADVLVTFNGAVVSKTFFDGQGLLVAMMYYENLGEAKPRVEGIITYNIKAPVVGENPSYEAENQREDRIYVIDKERPGSINGIIWEEGIGDDSRVMSPDDTFKPGVYYHVTIRVKPIAGYLFDTDEKGDFQLVGAINRETAICGGNEDSAFVGLTFDKLEAPVATENPTAKPTGEPTAKPTEQPTEAPVVTEKPTEVPTAKPTEKPTAKPTEKPQATETPEKITFTDVAKGEYYYDPVLWAVEEGITSGTSATTFSPNSSCTRAQVVTFLHRMVGSPMPAAINNPFADVADSAYYYDPVLWAFGSKITGGTSETTFSPDSPCTRAQVVTFLWRCAGQPEAKGEKNPFSDVAAGSYYYDAVLWAVEEGITGGTSATTFSPDSPCTRAQVVTFLYRFIND